MKINIELNTKDIANAKQESINTITAALQAIAQADEVTSVINTSAPVTVMTTDEPKAHGQQPKTVKKASRPKKEQDKDIELEPATQEKTVAQEEPATQEKTDTSEKPVTQEEPATPEEPVQEAAVDRQAVQNRLKEIAKAGKAKGIKEILTKRNVRKFSELPDEDLADVLKEAEAL
ncbi:MULTISPECIES: hypothetical protein [unclassified Megasphaera]|uniref:hypothetical protein n=1 Tax=unclassified Megasphaera TaxID=2626256 RepID=UPI0025C3B93A|nr:hypothetical protein [Megasphaera sp. UBA4233]